MRLTKIAVAVATLIGMSTAYAGHNEQFWQADEGTNVVTPSFSYSMKTVEPKTGDKTTDNGMDLGVAYERGLTSAYSVGANLTYVSHKMEKGTGKRDVTGLDDLDFFMKGQQEGGFHWGVNLSYGIAKPTYKGEDYDAGTGALGMGLYLGFAHESGAGGKFSYAMPGEGDIDIEGTDTKVKNGSVMEVLGYYEHDAAGAHWGYEAAYVITDNSESDGVAAEDGHSDLRLKAYPTWEMGNGTLTTGLAYTMGMSEKSDLTDSRNDITFDVGYRMAF